MLLTTPTDDALYQALLTSDPAFEGLAWVCVKTTGIFCRLTCSARKPKRENVEFRHALKDCVDEGYRPCKRCRPLDTGRHPVIGKLLAAMDAAPERRWREADVEALDLDPSTVRRAFRRHYGMTFLQVARARRLGRAAEALAGDDSVIGAQIESGFESGSGFRDAFHRLIGTAPAVAKGRSQLAADWIETPIGPMIAVADESRLHLLEFNDRKALAAEIERLQKRQARGIAHRRTPPIDTVEAGLTRYFAGEAPLPEIDFGDHGTAFEREVWQALRAIPLGETRSYGQLAEALGRPGAGRAVARANGANQLALLLPCHRVIGADGSLTGYAGGLWRKRWLLEHERRMAMTGRNHNGAG